MRVARSSQDRTESLVARAQRGDRVAFDELAAAHRERILAFIETRLGSVLRQRVEPEDVLQVALLRVFASLDRFETRRFVKQPVYIGFHELS